MYMGRIWLIYMTSNISIMGKFDIKNQIWSIVKVKIREFLKFKENCFPFGNLIFV